MFKPIKDFITFIQKNTTNLNVGEEVNIMESSNEGRNSVIPTHFEEVNDANSTTRKEALTATHTNPPPDLDENDIEEQITTCKIEKPLPASMCLPTSVFNTDVASSFKQPSRAEYNHNNKPKIPSILPEEDDELADFKNDPMQKTAEGFCLVGSEMEDLPLHSADEAGDDLAIEDEDVLDERSLTEVEGNNKLFVAIDVDLQSSIASSNPDDPLAIDVATLTADADMIVNPLDSSASDEKIEVANNGEIVWYATDDIGSAENMQKSDNLNNTNIQTKPSLESNLQKRSGEDSNEETERNDNSDSGLGTETSSLLLQTTIDNSMTENTGYVDDNPCNRTFEKPYNSSCGVDGRKSMGNSSLILATASETSKNIAQLHTASPKITTAANITNAIKPTARKPLRSNLKRRHCGVDATLEEESPSSSSKTEQDAFLTKKSKRTITFDSVQVYYFPRQQGFGCVPSAGGCTLGMGSQHIDTKRLTLAEHAAELRRAHRQQLQEINPRGSSSDDTDESEEDYLSEGSGSDLDADSNGFLQPVPPKQRRALLKAAGVRKIDTSEKIDCRNIRNSREVCGCTCRDFCDPETCTCSRAGIKCQVDRAMFPCGCSRDACGNTTGRVEFNPARVRTHFIHTIMRLDMENRQQQPATAGYDAGLLLSNTPNTGVVAAANYYNSIQPQSNYSSGYASPAYTTDSGASFLPQQNLLYSNHHNETIAANGGEPYHSLESIDGNNIYSSSTTPSYGEILPNYATTQPMAAAIPLPFNNTQNLNFPTPSYMTYPQQQNQLHHHQSNLQSPTNYLAQSQLNNENNSNGPNVYSSCAVPSRPPYGTATTCTSTLTSSDSNFINLNAPVASSSRLSQINDLLQNNRNTTAALVAVSTNNCTPPTNMANNSTVTPPINESQKACFVFETDLGMETVSNKTFARLLSPPPQSEPPPTATAMDSLCNFSQGNSGGCNYPI